MPLAGFLVVSSTSDFRPYFWKFLAFRGILGGAFFFGLSQEHVFVTSAPGRPPGLLKHAGNSIIEQPLTVEVWLGTSPVGLSLAT